MIAEEHLAQETRQRPSSVPRPRLVPQPPPEPSVSERGKASILWRIVFFFAGLALLMLGWPLAASGIGAFIGMPLIIFGLALMQAQER
jgi:hypothetical protein